MRTYQQVLNAMADAAALSDVREGLSWADALFASGADGATLSRPGDPDRALLAAIADELVRLDAHAGTLPARLQVEWMQGLLGMPRLPVVPDRVVVAASVEPKLAPAVVPRATLLRGGKDAFGNERRYRTVDTLTAFGALLEGVRVQMPGGPTPGEPGLALAAPDFPIVPPENAATAPATDLAPHRLRISNPLLAFAAGSLAVNIEFVGATTAAVAALCASSRWRHSRTDGSVGEEITATASGIVASLVLEQGCIDPYGGLPWIEAVVRAGSVVPEGLSFTDVRVQVARTNLVPDAAYANDGAVDHTKEFEPFGITAKVGDAFYIRCDEALSKPLESLAVSVAEFPPVEAIDWSDPSYYGYEMTPAQLWAALMAALAAAINFADDEYTGPTFEWQVFRNDEWEGASYPVRAFQNVALDMNNLGSDVTMVGGQDGRFIRGQLQRKDLGWRAYQEDLADFATAAVDGGGTMPSPPEPQLYYKLRVTYTTAFSSSPVVQSWSGWRHSTKGTTAWTPFRRTVDALGATGMVAFGVLLPASAAGSSFSLYVDLVSPSPCGSSELANTRWEWWAGTEWRELLVADGTNRMREPGLVRFVVPDGWAEGCADVTAERGKWLRFVTDHPNRLGIIRGAIPDAVVAEFASMAADPQTDPSPEIALPIGTIKGPLSPISGIKKMTNLASVRGRGPEDDGAYLRRASAQVRHRGRAISAWDYEQIISTTFPEIAAVQCLPHTDSEGHRAPGYVGIVLLPDQRDRPAPRASVSLAGKVRDTLKGVTASGVHTAILCPEYEAVRVDAAISLRPGVAAITGRATLLQAIETFLHPLGTAPVRWGQTLYASSVIAMLERLPEVDIVTSFSLHGPDGITEEVPVDRCRGLYCSSGDHQLSVEEQL